MVDTLSMTRMQRTLQVLRSLREEKPVAKKAVGLPPIGFLQDRIPEYGKPAVEAAVLEARLSEFGIEGRVENICRGPVVTRYEVRLAPGTRLAKVRSIAEDLAVALAGNVRILAPIPGTSLVGVETINDKLAVTGLRNTVQGFNGTLKLPIALGVDTVGSPSIMDLADAPHLLVAGQTGSGKSVFLNSLIMSILYSKTPAQCGLVLVDPKRVEMASYRNLPHLLRPVATEPAEAVEAFRWLVAEMERRYTVLEGLKVRNIEGTNMPYVVAIIDEMADLMDTAGSELTDSVVRLAQKSRAVGIHLVLATQRPDVKVLNGRIKANIPARIAFKVASQTDSRVILDEGGAEKLAGKGDMLLRLSGDPERFHGAWVSDQEITTVVSYVEGV